MAGSITQNYANMLELLLRLRQACDHPLLTINGRKAEPAAGSAPALGSPPTSQLASRTFSDIEDLVAKFMSDSDGTPGAYLENFKRDLHAFAGVFLRF